MAKTKESVFKKLTRAVAGRSKVDDDVLDELEEILITSDVGVDTTLKIIGRIEEDRFIMDVRTIAEGEFDIIIHAFEFILQSPAD